MGVTPIDIVVRGKDDNLSNTIRDIQGKFDELRTTAKATEQAVTSLSGALGIVAGVLGTVGTAFLVATKQVANYGEEINKAAIQTGLTTEQISGLKFALEQSESSLSRFIIGFQTFAKEQVKLGHDNEDTMESLLTTVDRFNDLETSIQKVNFARQNFGKAGEDLIPFLKEGRAGIQGMIDDAEKLGQALDPKASKAADAFNDALNRLFKAIDGIKNKLAQFFPFLTPVVDKLTEFVSAVSKSQVQFGFLGGIPGLVEMGRVPSAVMGRFPEFEPLRPRATQAPGFESKLAGEVHRRIADVIRMPALLDTLNWDKLHREYEKQLREDERAVEKAQKTIKEIIAHNQKELFERTDETLKLMDKAWESHLSLISEGYKKSVDKMIKDLTELEKIEKFFKEEAPREFLSTGQRDIKEQVAAGEAVNAAIAKKIIKNMEDAKKKAAEFLKDFRDVAGGVFDFIFTKSKNVFQQIAAEFRNLIYSIGRVMFQDLAQALLLGPVGVRSGVLGGLLAGGGAGGGGGAVGAGLLQGRLGGGMLAAIPGFGGIMGATAGGGLISTLAHAFHRVSSTAGAAPGSIGILNPALEGLGGASSLVPTGGLAGALGLHGGAGLLGLGAATIPVIGGIAAGVAFGLFKLFGHGTREAPYTQDPNDPRNREYYFYTGSTLLADAARDLSLVTRHLNTVPAGVVVKDGLPVALQGSNAFRRDMVSKLQDDI